MLREGRTPRSDHRHPVLDGVANGAWAVAAVAVVAYLFLLAPLVVIMGASLNREHMAFPPQQLSLIWFAEVLRRPEFTNAAKISLLLSSCAAVASSVLAVPITLQMRRASPRVRSVITAAFLGPLLVPSVILALGLYQVVLRMLGTTSFWALLIGHIVITLPFPIRTIAAVAEGFDPALEDAAASVGATPFQTLIRITLPLWKAGVIAGALFAFIVSWNDFPISIFLAPPQSIPLPVRIYTYILFEYKPLVAAVSTYLVVLSVMLIYVIERLVGLSVFVGSQRH